MDFTLDAYRHLLEALRGSGYAFMAFEDFADGALPPGKTVVLRHDVDRIPGNALRMARLEHEQGVRASYFFRCVPHVWDEAILRAVAELGHEVAYHYEDLTLARGDQEQAIEHFGQQLERFREIYPSRTICMHGSPLSRWDNRDIWKHYDYRDYGIIAEPYFDVDYGQVFYLTDTGRAWNHRAVSVRDKVDSGFEIPVRSSAHLSELLRQAQMPKRLIINTHPHRWFQPGFNWYRELLGQNVKNIVKSVLVRANF